ncbi:MgtC family protein [compost metagenome]
MKGLTTGAGLWFSGSIGLACGLGFWEIAVLATGFAIVVLWLLSFLDVGSKSERDEA